MRKIIFLHNLLAVALVVGAVGIPASLHSQQNYTLNPTGFVTYRSEITTNISDRTLSVPPVALALAEDQPRQAPAHKTEEQPNEVPQAPFEQIINRAASTHEVDPHLIKAIIMAESRYNPRAVSKRGARGLMQLMPVTAKSLGVEDSFDPEENINGGVMYFRKLLDRFDGNVEFALAAYNAGSRYVRKYGGVPPFRQTRTYIHKVFKYQRQYKQEVEKSGKVA